MLEPWIDMLLSLDAAAAFSFGSGPETSFLVRYIGFPLFAMLGASSLSGERAVVIGAI